MTHPSRLRGFLGVAVLFLALAGSCFGQSETATLSGTIVDQSGALVPGVQVTVTNQDTNISAQGKTTGAGVYSVPGLKPGTYHMLVEKDGFKKVAVRDIILNVQDVVSRNFTLEVGGTSETVQVEGGISLVNTESATVGTVVDRQFVENIPLNGRSFQSLIELTPGVLPTTGDAASGSFSVNGQRQDANAFTVDGVSANFGGAGSGSGTFAIVSGTWASGNVPGLTNLGTTQTLASVDAMQEFRVQTSTYSAEYGRQPGGQISIVTRSGTNNFHGSLYEYLRNTVFDANNWFANFNNRPRPPEQQNDFGGTLGGPVRIPGLYNGKDRTFFFFSYEGLRLRLPQFNLTNVPTIALRQSAPASLQPILNAFPLPNGKDLGNGLAEFAVSYSNPSNLDATSVRIDHRINDKWGLFGRYNRVPSYSTARLARELAVFQLLRASPWTATLGLTGSFSSALTNDFRINYSSNSALNPFPSDSFGGAKPVGIEALVPSQYITKTSGSSVFLRFPGITADGSLVGWSANNPFDVRQAQFNVVDSVAYRLGPHQLKFGVDYRRVAPRFDVFGTSVNASFTSQQQVLNGVAPTGNSSTRVAAEPRYTNYSLFAQDSWKVTRRLTADLGLRWDVNPAPGAANSASPLAVDQVKNFATMGLVAEGTSMWKTTYKNFGPRLGLAYQIIQASGHETVLRGGFGVFYDTGNNLGSAQFQGYPTNVSRSFSNVTFPIVPAQVAPPPPLDLNNLTPPYGTLFVFDPRLKLPYTLQWNVAIEQAFGANQALTVSYVGSNGRRLLINQQYTISSINPKFTTVEVTSNRAESNYSALQAQFQRRLSSGWQGLVSYTWSHAIDTASADFASVFPPIRGNSDFDVRQLMAGAFVYNTPKFEKNRFAEVLFGNWSLDGGIHAQSSPPVNVIANQVLNPVTGEFSIIFPNIVAGVPFYLSGTACTASNGGVPCPGGRRINTVAFQAPPAGQNGNLGRNVLRGLPSWQIDFALDRRFNLTEKLDLAFRAEAFNLLNHADFGLPATLLTAKNFGEPTVTQNVAMSGLSSLYQIGGPRSLQLSLKLRF
jgi:hypothetical protein